MKNPTLFCFLSLILFLAVVNGCNEPMQELRDIKDDSMDFSRTSGEEEETMKYLDDMENYKLNAALDIERINNQLTQMKEAASQDREAVKRKNLDLLDQFERQNNDLRMRLNDYTGDGIESWRVFKSGFTSDRRTLENTVQFFGKKTGYLTN